MIRLLYSMESGHMVSVGNDFRQILFSAYMMDTVVMYYIEVIN